jgi:hypothetical protein
MSCDDCRFRAIHDRKPKSLLGRIWRWHINFCPGWKKYFRNLPEDKQQELAIRYDLKTK